MSSKISTLVARQVLDSRGRPTVEAEVQLASGARGRSIVPSGISTGQHEAVELRDRSDTHHYGGLGVRLAVANVRGVIAPELAGHDAADQAGVDQLMIELDGTPNKARLGANAMLAVSLAVARAAAANEGLRLWRYLAVDRSPRLPRPMVNILSGGLHADRNLDIQDFLVVPTRAATFVEALEVCVRFHSAMRDALHERGLTTLRADEGGFGPPLAENKDGLDLMMAAAERSHLSPGDDIWFALDVAASHFYDPDRNVYGLASENKILEAGEVVDLLSSWVHEYPLCSIEDGLAEDDWQGWKVLTQALGSNVQLVGDDLFTTNLDRLRMGVDLHVANAGLVKMNQVGTLTETLQFIDAARAAGYVLVASARSGETEDSTLADLSVAAATEQIKIGSVTGSERLAKYNELLRIEEELGESATIAPFERRAAR